MHGRLFNLVDDLSILFSKNILIFSYRVNILEYLIWFYLEKINIKNISV